jgi:folylpolyglutamate synthase/dihydropteroate synthase
VICTALDLARALPANVLAGRWSAVAAVASVGAAGAGLRIVAEADVDTALDRALSEARGPIVVCGSLYLVGRARARLVDDPLLDDPVEPPIR